MPSVSSIFPKLVPAVTIVMPSSDHRPMALEILCNRNFFSRTKFVLPSWNAVTFGREYVLEHPMLK